MRSAGRRRGIILPVVLVCGFLLALVVLTFQLTSSSGYRQVARLVRDLQAAALADLAFDELFLQLEDVSFGAGEPMPPWLAALLDEVDAARPLATPGAVGPLDVTEDVDVIDRLPVTRDAAGRADDLITLVDARLRIGPFAVLGGEREGRMLYAEPAFGDAGQDRRAWDLRAPYRLELDVASPQAPFSFSKTYSRGLSMQITDTVPPASSFALFSYLRSIDEDQALNDLQEGGRLAVVPGANGRVMVRGPLVLVTESGESSLQHLGGDRPDNDLPYPDTYWTGWAAVPGPRSIPHPQESGTGLISALLGSINTMLAGVQGGTDPRRPGNLASHSVFRIQAFNLPLPDISSPIPGFSIPDSIPIPPENYDLGEVSVVMASELDSPTPNYQTIDDDQVAFFPPMAYIHGLSRPGSQGLSLKVPTNDLYRGALVRADDDSPPEPFPGAGTALSEGDAVLVEPIPEAGASAGLEAGLLGLYGVGLLDSRTYGRVVLYDVVFWRIQDALAEAPAIIETALDLLGLDAASLSNMALDVLGLSGARDLPILLRRFAARSKIAWDPSVPLTLAGVADDMEAGKVLVAPYGHYWHTAGFWDSPLAPPIPAADLAQDIRTPLLTLSPGAVLNRLLIENGTPDWAAVDAMVTADPTALLRALEDWLVTTHQDFLLRNVEGATPGSGVDRMRRMVRDRLGGDLPGFHPLSMTRVKRPDGAFGGHENPGAVDPALDAVLAAEHPRGFYPPGFRLWEETVTRSYPDFDAYLAEASVNGVLELKGVVHIQDPVYPPPGDGVPQIPYRGRGVILLITEDAARPARLNAVLVPDGTSPDSQLILAHRVAHSVVEGGDLPPLELGPDVVASVYSDTGVRPAGDRTTVTGNLVTGWLNKRSIDRSTDPDDGVLVVYADGLADRATGSRRPSWTVQLGGEVSSLEPGE